MKIFKIKRMTKEWKKLFGSEEVIKGSLKLKEGDHGPKLNTIDLTPEVKLNCDMNKTYHTAIVCTFVSTDEGYSEYIKLVTELK